MNELIEKEKILKYILEKKKLLENKHQARGDFDLHVQAENVTAIAAGKVFAEAINEWIQSILSEMHDDIGRMKFNPQDNYHSMHELYEHRHALFGIIAKHYNSAWKSKRDNDGTMFDGGWFMAGFKTKNGEVAYHLPIQYFHFFPAKEIERTPPWHEYTSDDALKRLFAEWGSH